MDISYLNVNTKELKKNYGKHYLFCNDTKVFSKKSLVHEISVPQQHDIKLLVRKPEIFVLRLFRTYVEQAYLKSVQKSEHLHIVGSFHLSFLSLRICFLQIMRIEYSTSAYNQIRNGESMRGTAVLNSINEILWSAILVLNVPCSLCITIERPLRLMYSISKTKRMC